MLYNVTFACVLNTDLYICSLYRSVILKAWMMSEKCFPFEYLNAFIVCVNSLQPRQVPRVMEHMKIMENLKILRLCCPGYSCLYRQLYFQIIF